MMAWLPLVTRDYTFEDLKSHRQTMADDQRLRDVIVNALDVGYGLDVFGDELDDIDRPRVLFTRIPAFFHPDQAEMAEQRMLARLGDEWSVLWDWRDGWLLLTKSVV